MFKEHRCETLGRTPSAQRGLLGAEGKAFSKRKGDTKDEKLEGRQRPTHRRRVGEQAGSGAGQHGGPGRRGQEEQGWVRVWGKPLYRPSAHPALGRWASQVMSQLISTGAEGASSGNQQPRSSELQCSGERDPSCAAWHEAGEWEEVPAWLVTHKPSPELPPVPLGLPPTAPSATTTWGPAIVPRAATACPASSLDLAGAQGGSGEKARKQSPQGALWAFPASL